MANPELKIDLVPNLDFRLTFEGVGGRCDRLPAGVAFDGITANTLIEFLKVTGSTEVKIYGDLKAGVKVVGYYSFQSAFDLVYENAPKAIS
jgi:hypothetical protein